MYYRKSNVHNKCKAFVAFETNLCGKTMKGIQTDPRDREPSLTKTMPVLLLLPDH